jgi:FkbH-like protein
MVRESIPELTVPELPADPADYLEYLYSLNLFETVSFSDADTERPQQYRTEAQRVSERQGYHNEDDFLKALDMVSVVEPFNKFNTPRAAQLSQRSNQFNLRTIRYTELDVEMLTKSPGYFTFTFTLTDKFGDNGLICIIVLCEQNSDTLFIENWLMSCRVLKRGMENFVLNIIADFAKREGYSYLKGEYLPTGKNEMVKDHYKNLGFDEGKDFWLLNLCEFKNRNCFISRK